MQFKSDNKGIQMMYGKRIRPGYHFIENEADRKILVAINGVIRALLSGKYSFLQFHHRNGY